MSVVRERHSRLRSLYRDRPDKALSRKAGRTSASRVPAADAIHGEVEIGRGYGTSIRFGLDQKVGGLSDHPNPGDLLCAALAACEDGTIRMIAELMGVSLEDLEVEVEGTVDVRGTLAIDPSVRVGFETLRCRIRLRVAPGTDPRLAEKLVGAAGRFCVNLDTLRGGVDVEVEEQIQQEGAADAVR